MPTENTASSSVTTCSSPPRTSLTEARELREEERAVEPEPRDAEHRQEDGAVLAREADEPPRLGERVPANPQRRRLGAARSGRDRLASQPATATPMIVTDTTVGPQRGTATSTPPRIVPTRMATNVNPLDQRVAADQLVLAQELRQDAVLHRPEERRVHAHQEQRAEQDRGAAQLKPDGCDHHDRRSRRASPPG